MSEKAKNIYFNHTNYFNLTKNNYILYLINK